MLNRGPHAEDDARNAPYALSLNLLAGDTLLYGTIAALSRLSALLLIPIFARGLSVSDFGILDTIWTMTTLALILGNGGVDLALTYYYHQHGGNERNSVVATGLWMRVLLGLAVSAIGIATSAAVSDFAFGTPDHAAWVALMYLSVPFTLAVNYSLDLLRNERRRGWFVALSLARVAFLVAGVVWLVTIRPPDLVAAFLIFRVVPDALSIVILLLVLRGRYAIRLFDRDAARRLLAYGLPLVPANLLLWFLGFVDRWHLYLQGMVEQAGVYAMAVKVGMVVTVGVTALQMAFNPLSVAVKDHAGAPTFYARAFSLAMFTSVGAVLAIAANLEGILLLAGGGAYGGADLSATILLVGNLSAVAAVFFATAANLERKTGAYLYSAAAAVVVAFVCCRLFVVPWGSPGVAAAIALGQGTFAAGMLLLVRKSRPIPYALFPVVCALVLCGGLALALAVWRGEIHVVQANIIALAGIAGGGLLIVPAKERRAILHSARGLWRSGS